MRNYLRLFSLILFLIPIFIIAFVLSVFLSMQNRDNTFHSNNLTTPILINSKNEFSPYLHSSSNFDTTIKSSNSLIEREENQIYGVVVPHHLLAHTIISQTFESVANNYKNKDKEISQIVLLSPNHFLAGKEKIITSDGDWQTKFGIVESDEEFIKKISLFGFATVDYQAMEGEHGIFDLTPFIKYFFPKAEITPLMIKEPLVQKEFEELALFLKNNLSENALVIVSADFSHYLPKPAADFHDRSSIAALSNFDFDFLKKIDVDTPSSLAVLLKYLQLKNTQRFVLIKNANSADFIRSEEIRETTSYIGGYFTGGSQDFRKHLTLLAFGDLMLDRNVAKHTKKAENFNHPFLNLDLFLKGVDFRLANLEGPITNFSSKAEKTSGMQFTFSPNFIKPLQHRFEIFNLANNHTLDFGQKGFDETRDFLAKANIKFFGNFQNKSEDLSNLVEKNGIKIGLVGYNQLSNSNFDEVIGEIKRLKEETDFVIVYPHWGAEYQTNFSKIQQGIAYQFIDAGADLILGSHPHVIQPIEIYKNKVIFYSLGNFVFDQYFSQNTLEGLSVGIFLQKENDKIRTSYWLFPTQITKESQAQLADLKTTKKILERLSKTSSVDETIKESIRRGIIEFP